MVGLSMQRLPRHERTYEGSGGQVFFLWELEFWVLGGFGGVGWGGLGWVGLGWGGVGWGKVWTGVCFCLRAKQHLWTLWEFQFCSSFLGEGFGLGWGGIGWGGRVFVSV